MKTLEITEQRALQAYGQADDKGKSMLTNLFGSDVFNKKITDRVKTFEDALSIVGMTQPQFDVLYGTSNQSQAFGKLEVIAKALNEGWKPDWNNGNQYKYHPYFDMYNGFSFCHVDFNCLFSHVGSRLCFHSRALAEYAGKQFSSIYETLFTL